MADRRGSSSFGSTLATRQEVEDQQGESVDFKMVTFSLGGKDYGIDIMQIKEIAKFSQFTYVPNSPPFVRGVYNLRGEIISIIDLRLFFNLPVVQRQEGVNENGLILRLGNNLIGVIVDEIDKVVGINSETIQPPHPIFGDINIKYISGVVENDGRLYIILDVERIFVKDEKEEKRLESRSFPADGADQTEPTGKTPETASYHGPEPRDETRAAYKFVIETLETFLGFYVTPLNERWVRERFEEWSRSKGKSAQLQSREEAEEFLQPFYSRFSRRLWPDEYVEKFLRLTSIATGGIIQIWNPGCGEGSESYSLAVSLKDAHPDRQVKVWASDNDLLAISNAPNVIYDRDRVPDLYEPYIVDGINGPSFSMEIKNAIIFEYSDLANVTGLPAMDLIVARDVLSFFDEQRQERILETIFETLKPNGYLMLGDHEEPLSGERWERKSESGVTVYRKRS
ncbi:MAG: CheR family methyltransferase [Spirochaetaceae bacterium]